MNAAGPMETGVDGIALSCDGAVLFYTPLTSRTLYSIQTTYLRNWTVHDLNPYVTDLGYKVNASGGLAASSEGSLYLTALEISSVYGLSPYTDDRYSIITISRRLLRTRT